MCKSYPLEIYINILTEEASVLDIYAYTDTDRYIYKYIYVYRYTEVYRYADRSIEKSAPSTKDSALL